MSAASWRLNGSSSSCGTTWLTRPQRGGGGVDVVAGGAHLPGPPHADGLGQQHGEPPPRHDPDAGVGVGEPGPIAGDQEVARQGQLEPAGDGHAVDGADDRLGVGRERPPLSRVGSTRSPASPSPSRGPTPDDPSSLRSTPAQKAGSAPVRTMTSTSSSASSSMMTSRIRRWSARLSALRWAGPVEGHGGDPVGHARPAPARRRRRWSRSWSGLLDVERGQEVEGEVADPDEHRRDPAAHGREVVVEDRAVLQRGLVEVVGALVGDLDGVLGIVEVAR